MRDRQSRAEYGVWVIGTILGAVGVAFAIVSDIRYDISSPVNPLAGFSYLLLVFASQFYFIAILFATASATDTSCSGSKSSVWMSVAAGLLLVYLIWSTCAAVYRPSRLSPIPRTEIRISYIWLVLLSVGVGRCYSMIKRGR